MSKKQRLKDLSNLIKETYNLDVVTTAHTKSQQHKLDMTFNPDIVVFKMRYRLTGGDVVQLCPISWLAINADEDDLIVRTCGEVLASHTAVKRTLSWMAQNAEARANGT